MNKMFCRCKANQKSHQHNGVIQSDIGVGAKFNFKNITMKKLIKRNKRRVDQAYDSRIENYFNGLSLGYTDPFNLRMCQDLRKHSQRVDFPYMKQRSKHHALGLCTQHIPQPSLIVLIHSLESLLDDIKQEYLLECKSLSHHNKHLVEKTQNPSMSERVAFQIGFQKLCKLYQSLSESRMSLRRRYNQF